MEEKRWRRREGGGEKGEIEEGRGGIILALIITAVWAMGPRVFLKVLILFIQHVHFCTTFPP